MNDHYQQRNYPTQIDIPIQFRPQAIEMLNLTLATIMDLKTEIRQSQWNQEMNFYQPHELFDEVVPVLEEYIDKFAAALGGQAIGTARTEAKLKSLPEYPFRQLKPSTRIVSHDFDMGEWKPERVVKTQEGSTIYYWVIPKEIPANLR